MQEMWMTDSEKTLFLHLLNKEDIYLEWGSGGSTSIVPDHVKKVYSIEHDEEWFNKMKAELAGKFDNLQCFLVPNDKPRSFPYVKKEEFINYIEFVNDLGKEYGKFDKVLIDGRARIWCAEEVIPHLNKDAIVFIHDWDRTPYHEILKWYKLYRVCGRMAALKLK